MNKKVKFFTEADKKIIKKLVKEIGSDGHTIWKSSVLKKAGAGAFVKRFEETITSSKTNPKYAIFDNGKLVKKLKGVHGLRVLMAICSDLNLKFEDKLGRGSQACACTSAIEGWLTQK
jgi:hypothetical protein